MLEVFYEAFIHIFAVSLIAAVTGCFALAGARAVGQGMSARSAWRTIFWLGVLLAVWFTFDIIAAKAGLMTWAPAKLAPPVLSVILAVMPVLLLVLAAAIGPARRVARHLGQAELMGLQGFRILGWFFLVGWAVGDIPAVFAFPAALGDIWAGLEGIRAARKVRNGSADAERAVLRANIIGLGDFAVAVTLGLFTIEGTFNLLSPDAPSIVGYYPLVMIPVLFVPTFITLHILSLQALWRRGVAKTEKYMTAGAHPAAEI